MKLHEIAEVLDQIAPPELAEGWDNVGLLAGDPQQQIKKVLLTIDLTAEVLAEAQAKKADLIIAYHPPIWESLKKIIAGRGPAPLIHQAIRANIAIYSPHTALDSVKGGINDLLAESVGIKNPQPLQPVESADSANYKLVVFIPVAEVEKVSEAIFAAGAGNIGEAGKYSRCSFRAPGTGTFQCGPYSRPAIGKPGSFEQVEEIKFETIVPITKIPTVVKAMLAAHPYEEVAYDLIPLRNAPTATGIGRFGDLAKPVAIPALIEKIKKTFQVKVVGIIGPQKGRIKRAAVGAGSCGTLLRSVIANNCDFFLTGELKHHHALELQAAGITAVCLSHSVSERIILPRLAQRLQHQCKGIQVYLSRKDRDPFTWQ